MKAESVRRNVQLIVVMFAGKMKEEVRANKKKSVYILELDWKVRRRGRGCSCAVGLSEDFCCYCCCAQ